jgi:dephospho-CoA kinase
MYKKPVIGILGGVGSGKSTVSRLFAQLGGAVIDADRLAHEVLKQPQVIEQICRRFGSGTVDETGHVNHKALAEIAFKDNIALESLNKIIHPQVIEKIDSLLKQYKLNTSVRAIILDIPLLVEIGWQNRCDYLVFVECSFEERLKRLAETRQFDEIQLKKRENFQISLDKKAQIAHYIINNNSDESEVAEQVAQIFSSITSSE